MKRATRKQWRLLEDEMLDVRHSFTIRLRNALIAMAEADPQWMIWVEENINPRWRLSRITRVVEARTRALFLKGHGYFGRKNIGDLIFREGWCFTERGTLSAG